MFGFNFGGMGGGSGMGGMGGMGGMDQNWLSQNQGFGQGNQMGLSQDTTPTAESVMGGYEDYEGISDSSTPTEDTRNDNPMATGWKKYAAFKPGEMPTSPIAPTGSSSQGGIPQIAPVQAPQQGLMQSQAGIPQIDRPWLMG